MRYLSLGEVVELHRRVLNLVCECSQGGADVSGSAKQKVLEATEKLPGDATLEDAIERSVLLVKIERGVAELDARQGIDHSEAKRRLLR